MPTVNGYATGEPVEATDINQYFLRGSRNIIINGDMGVNQRGTSTAGGAVADAAYGLDRWVFLGDATTGTINQSSIAPSGGVFSMSCVPVTSNKKFGFVQIIENKNLAGLRFGTVSLSFKMQISGANLNNVKAAVISWAGTADSVTRDVVSTWNASGTAPTLAANWSYCNTPTNLFTVAGSWVTCKLTALVNNPTVNNLAVFIWCDTTAVTNTETLYLTDVQLEAGAIATPFERRVYSEQLAACQRYYTKFYVEIAGHAFAVGYYANTSLFYWATTLPVQMRATPNISTSNAYVDSNVGGGAWTIAASKSTPCIIAAYGNVAVLGNAGAAGVLQSATTGALVIGEKEL